MAAFAKPNLVHGSKEKGKRETRDIYRSLDGLTHLLRLHIHISHAKTYPINYLKIYQP